MTISPDAFRNELFASTSPDTSDLYFTGVIRHHMELKNGSQSTGAASGGTDAALAALQNSLASYEQEKQAKQTNITTSILPPPKNRFEAARREKLGKRGQLAPTPNASLPASPAFGPHGAASTSIAITSNPDDGDGVRWQAMKTPLLHLLATKPASSETLASKTHVPHQEVLELLQKYGRQIESKWQLTDRAYRELDVWKFKYPSKESRQAAIDGAIKAFDRLRIGKEDDLWQMLLPRGERGQGKVLSRLHLGSGSSQNRGLTPTYQGSPMPHVDGHESKSASAVNTPRLGASTPRPGSSKGDVMKRLLSKDPAKARKAREVEAAKERKRKEREAAASDREVNGRPSKKQATQKATANVKSAEYVQSSDEDSSSEVVASRLQKSEQIPKPKAKDRSTAVTSISPDSSDEDVKARTVKSSTAHSRTASTNSMKTASPALKASKPKPAGQSTPQTSQSLSAPASQHKSQRSPQKHDSRPNVPSPLGAARPRLASDVSERSAVGVQRVKHNGESTPRGLGISNGTTTKARDETSAGSGTAPTSASLKQSGKSVGTPKQMNTTNPDSKASSGITKRKADASKESLKLPSKHRKTESTSSLSHSSTNNGSGNYSSGTSPSDPLSGSSVTSSDSTTAPLREISYAQGTNIAQSFRDTYYPAYVKLYDEQSAMEARGEKVPEADRDRLLRMHRRLEQMKEEIARGSRAGG